jgi:hypothetical protein
MSRPNKLTQSTNNKGKNMETETFIYKDAKHKPFMAYVGKPYPYGEYVGHFSSLKETMEAIKSHKPSGAIPLNESLIDWRANHGFYDMDGLELIKV